MEQPNHEKTLSIEKLNERLCEVEAFEKKHLELHKDMMRQLQPISDAFSNVSGFGRVSIGILKVLALLGVGIGVLYGLVQFLRK